jgi:hypothetical protein
MFKKAVQPDFFNILLGSRSGLRGASRRLIQCSILSRSRSHDLRRRSLLRLSLSVGLDCFRFMDGLLESLDRFSETFPELRNLSRPENNQDDDQDQE